MSSPYEQFESNLSYARNMVTGGRALEGLHGIGANYGDLAAAHPEDLYRAAWSQAVAALDHWLHEEVLARAVALVRSEERPLPDRLSKLKLPLATVEQMADNPLGSVFAEFVTEEIRRDTYQRSRGISEGLRLITHLNAQEIWERIAEGLGVTAARARERQDFVVERRNRIAHQADLGADGRRTPMAASDVEAALVWIEGVAGQIVGILSDVPKPVEVVEAAPAWMVRGGRQGRFESWALENGSIGIGFHRMGDLTAVEDRAGMVEAAEEAYKGENPRTVSNHAGQLWAFRGKIQVGDLVVMPVGKSKALAVGRVTGDYSYVPEAPDGTRHRRSVEWIRTDLPRTALGRDLSHSLGSILTVCQLWKNDAARRLAELAGTGIDPGPGGTEG